jgi:hypothetical protein
MKIALLGKICSGKTYVSNALSRRCALKQYSFADKLKSVAKDLFNMHYKDRVLLQKLGKSMRDIDPYVWINYLLFTIDKDTFGRFIVDDVRFPNELMALKERGFIIIKLVVDKDVQKRRIMETYPLDYDKHLESLSDESEIHIDNMEGDFTVKSDENVIENIMKCIDPYYGQGVDSNVTISASLF